MLKTQNLVLSPSELTNNSYNAAIRSKIVSTLVEAANKEAVFVSLFDVIEKLHSLYEAPKGKKKPHFDICLEPMLKSLTRELSMQGCKHYDVSTEETAMDVIVMIPEYEDGRKPSFTVKTLFK